MKLWYKAIPWRKSSSRPILPALPYGPSVESMALGMRCEAFAFPRVIPISSALSYSPSPFRRPGGKKRLAPEAPLF